MKVVYIAHPLGQGPDRERNRRMAAAWVGVLARVFSIAPVADWIVLSGEWTEEMRERGLAIDMTLVKRCDEVWLVGPRVSAGMQAEANRAEEFLIPVRDLTGMTYMQAIGALSATEVPRAAA